MGHKGRLSGHTRRYGANIRITTPYRKELADQNSSNSPYELKVREVEGYYNMGQNPDGNGETFIVDMEPVMSASKSVPTLLKELATRIIVIASSLVWWRIVR